MTPQEKKIVSLRGQLARVKGKLATALELVRATDNKLSKSKRRLDSLAQQYAAMINLDKAKSDPKYESKLKQTIDYFQNAYQEIRPVAEAARAANAQDINRDQQNRRMNRPIARAGQPPMARGNARGRWPIAPPPRFAQAFRRIVNPVNNAFDPEPAPRWNPQAEVMGLGRAQEAMQPAMEQGIPVQERGVEEGWEPG